MSDRPIDWFDPNTFQQLAKHGADVSHVGIRKGSALPIKIVDQAKRQIDFVISTASLDRDNDTINVNGWELRNYVKNPVVLFAHNNRDLPVGTSIRTYIDQSSLHSTCQFVDRDLYPFGDMVYRFYLAGVLKATSVGYKPLEWSYAEDRKYGVNFQRQELLEYSCCAVPSNPDALIEARSKGIDTDPMRDWCERRLADNAIAADPRAKRTLEILREAASTTGRPLTLDLGSLSIIDLKGASAVADVADPEVKAGRRLSSANKDKVKSAYDHMKEAYKRAKTSMTCAEELMDDDDAEEDDDDKSSKSGRSLSAKTREKLKSMVDHGDEAIKRAKKHNDVLKGMLEPPKNDTDGDDKHLSAEAIKDLVASAVKEAIDPAVKAALKTANGEDEIDAVVITEDLIVAKLTKEIQQAVNDAMGRVD